MIRPSAPFEARDPRGGYVVRKPRATDALGGSLRQIFEPDDDAPADLASLLRALDGVAAR